MTRADHMPMWQVQEAKQRFRVLRAAAKRPQMITRNGTPVVDPFG